MSNDRETVPNPQTLKNGATLGMIVHGVAMTRYPNLSNEQSMDGINYSVQDSCGAYGTITFSTDGCVGVFFDCNSNRSPFPENAPYNIDQYLLGIPDDLKKLAHDEVLQYRLEEYDGVTLPIITSAFWSHGGSEPFNYSDTWNETIKHGAWLVENQFLNTQAAMVNWIAYYDLSNHDIHLILQLYEQIITDRNERIILDESQKQALIQNASGENGIVTARETFLQIGIVF